MSLYQAKNWLPNGTRFSRSAERAKRAERCRLDALVMPPLAL